MEKPWNTKFWVEDDEGENIFCTNGERAVLIFFMPASMEDENDMYFVSILHGSNGEYTNSAACRIIGQYATREVAMEAVRELFRQGRFPYTTSDKNIAPDANYHGAELLSEIEN